MYIILYVHGPKEEQPCVEVGLPWLNKVESESESQTCALRYLVQQPVA